MDFRLVNVALDIFCTILSLLLMIYTLCQPGRRKSMNHWFVGICMCNMGMLLGDIPNWLCEGFARPWFPAALWLGCLLQFLCGVWITLTYTGYLTAFLTPRTQVDDRRYFYVIGVLGAVGTLLVLLNLWNGMYYYIDRSNVYHRGNWWWLSQGIAVVAMLLVMAVVVRNRRSMTNKMTLTFLAYQFIPLPAIVLQGLFYGLACTYPATTLCTVIMFLNIQSEQALLVEQQKREMAETHISLMLSQIQPHFLYNTLAAVEDLCETDPPKAQKAVGDFARYLRGNMQALSQREPIPFADELRHIRHYLDLEQMRFGDKLHVSIEVGPTDFLVPVLSVQPIVENAVKHGVTCRKAGGTVTLQTRETEHAWIVTVEDDGVGFAPDTPVEDGGEHVGLANVRSRLMSMVDGKLEIHSTLGVGTVVELVIPKRKPA